MKLNINSHTKLLGSLQTRETSFYNLIIVMIIYIYMINNDL